MYNQEDIYEPHDPFPYEDIYAREEGNEPDRHEQEEIILQKILQFLHPHRATPQASLCRLYSLLLLLRPSWLGKSSPTQVDLARKLNVSKSVMSAHCNEARLFFGVKSSACPRSDEARAKFSKLCKSRSGELAEARKKSREKKQKDTPYKKTTIN